MTKRERFSNLLIAAILVFVCILLDSQPKEGCIFVIVILSISFIVKGIRTLVYYFRLARFSIGGRSILYSGIVTLDIGIFTTLMIDLPNRVGAIYLIGTLLFSGLVSILRALEAKKVKNMSTFRFKLIFGLLHVVFSAVCLFFIDSPRTLVYLFSFTAFYSAIMRVISAFKKTTIVYMAQ